MKKHILFLACCIGLMLFASCKKDIQPTISVATEPEYVHQDSEVYSGDEIAVGFNVTGEKLTKVVISVDQNGTVLYTYTETLDNKDTYFVAKSFTIEATGTVLIGGTVTDAKGHTATTSFNIICDEKPNAKFVGHYEGDALITGSYDVEVSGMDPIHNDFEDQPFAAIVDISSGDNPNQVIATVRINDQANTIKGMVDGNKVEFEAINDTYNMTYQGVSVPLNMTYNITGTLNNGMLDLEGNCKGNGDINFGFISGTIELEGVVGGSLNKTE